MRWRESQRTLEASGAATFVEAGPGEVLAGLAKRTVPDVTVLERRPPPTTCPRWPSALVPTRSHPMTAVDATGID